MGTSPFIWGVQSQATVTTPSQKESQAKEGRILHDRPGKDVKFFPNCPHECSFWSIPRPHLRRPEEQAGMDI